MNYGIEIKIVNFMPQFGARGKYVSPFHMKATGTNGITSFAMEKPEFNSEADTVLNGIYKIAVQDASDSTAPVLFFPTKEENGRLEASIPVPDKGVNCALFYVLPDNVQVIAVDNPISANTPNSIYENSAGSPFSVTWTTKLKTNDQGVILNPETPLHGTVILKAPSGITIDAKSVAVESVFLKATEIISQTDGGVLVELEETSDFSASDYYKREKMFNTDISISCDAYLDSGAFIAEKTISMPYAQLSIWSDEYNTGTTMPLRYAISIISDLDVSATMKSAVTITPADLTIYQGGDDGYEGVYGDGQTELGSNSLPHPLFKITAPSSTDIDPAQLTFTTGEKTWTVVCDNPDSEGEKYYHFEAGANQTPVRVTYTNSEGTAVTSDEFDVTTVKDTYAEFSIDLYPGENNLSEVKAKTTDGTEYPISVNSGTLTVRAVENKNDPTSDIVANAPTSAVKENKAVAVAPAGTTYTLNDTGVQIPEVASDVNPDGSKPSLLFDDIIESDGEPRVEALEKAVDTKLGTTNGTRHYVAKYLDLVDANNGNAWISSSAGTDIYWGYPATTDKNTNFTLVHFQDLHRDGNNSGFDIDDIDSDNVDVLKTGERLTNTDYGIQFHVDKSGFSPFVLVWEAKPEPEPEPEPEPTPPPYIPPVDPDDTGVSDLLNTEDHIQYLFGYPEGTFGPENDMTRAEVAQMFYNLLLDQDVEITKTFDDVSEDAWYAKAVNTLASLGVVSGVGDNKFEPNRSITRAEFTTMAMKFAVGGEEGENIFSDVDEDDWFYKAVVDSIQYGWIHGYPDGTFRPNNSITRAEVTAIVNNMLGREADEDFVDEHAEELTQFSDIEKHWAYYHIAEATNDHDYTQPSSGENWTRLN